MTYYFKHTSGSITVCGERNRQRLIDDENWNEITEEEYNASSNPNTDVSIQKSILIGKRKKLLKAFDTYKINVLFGIESLTDSRKKEIIDWYSLVLDLNEDALNNPPSEIVYYTGEKFNIDDNVTYTKEEEAF